MNTAAPSFFRRLSLAICYLSLQWANELRDLEPREAKAELGYQMIVREFSLLQNPIICSIDDR